MPTSQHDHPHGGGSGNIPDVPPDTNIDRIAGPDDPIYCSGPVFTSLRPPPELTAAQQKAIVESMRLDPKYVRSRKRDMKYLIHDAPGYRLEAVVTRHPITGSTLELYSTWPGANHPDPHRLVTLTLPVESFARFCEVIDICRREFVEPDCGGDHG